MYLNMSFLPFCFVSFFPYTTTGWPALSSCSCLLFHFSTLFLYVPFSFGCNTILHIYLHACTCFSVTQASYPPLRPIHNMSWVQEVFNLHTLGNEFMIPEIGLHIIVFHETNVFGMSKHAESEANELLANAPVQAYKSLQVPIPD